MRKMEMYPNGFIVRAIDKTHEMYFGVEGDCWNIDEDTEGIEYQEGKYLSNFCSENINLSWSNDNTVDVSCDINFVNRYISAYIRANIQFEVLFCNTNKTIPNCHINIEKQAVNNFIFIGFDYAYSGGSFYSCVFNDLFCKRIPELLDIELNEYGLINSEEEVSNFIKRRNTLINKYEAGMFEVGQFTVYKLWKYVGDFPIVIT